MKSPTASTGMAARHSSETNEHYSSPRIVQAARETMGEIDLDPASCATANKVVGARHIYTKEEDGLSRPLCIPSRRLTFLRPDGTVWTSPPHASVIIYLPLLDEGAHLTVGAFVRAFHKIGRVRL